MKKLCPLIVICASWPQWADAEIRIASDTTIAFATPEQGKEILTKQDDFVRRMSPYDRAARMKTDREVSEEDYLEFVGRHVRPWNDRAKQKVLSALQGIQEELDALALPLPKHVLLIRTTGAEEGGAPYTRANAVVLPDTLLAAPLKKIRKIICHELFHLMSRANPELREKLYAAIGFEKCDELAFPPELRSRKITNPDAPKNDHCIRLEVDGEQHWAVPILFSKSEDYDAARGGDFFDDLQFRFLLVTRNEDPSTVTPIYDGKQPGLVSVQQVSGFFEQVGRNTQYIIHPEEILADNFALLVLGERDLPSPEIVRKLAEILKQER